MGIIKFVICKESLRKSNDLAYISHPSEVWLSPFVQQFTFLLLVPSSRLKQAQDGNYIKAPDIKIYICAKCTQHATS